jgi:hypothetical protein
MMDKSWGWVPMFVYLFAPQQKLVQNATVSRQPLQARNLGATAFHPLKIEF